MDFQKDSNRIFKEENGTLLAEITFPAVREGVVNINRTFVDSSLRGQGIAGQLMTTATEAIREKGYKTVASCSYAVDWFDKNPEIATELLIES